MATSQFALYQLKNIPENREKHFCPYQKLQEKGIKVRCGDYEQVYIGRMPPTETPENIRKQFDTKMPRTCRGHSISVSDVLVLNKEGEVTCYYVEKTGFTVITGFIRIDASDVPVSIDTTGFHIEGKEGSWLAFDSEIIDGKLFFLMEHEKYGREVAWVVVDESGKLIVDNVYNGFDQTVTQRIEAYFHPPKPVGESARQEKTSPADRQKGIGNSGDRPGSGIDRERKDTAIDGRKKPVSPKGKSGRPSVLAKLHQKQAEIAKRSGKPAP